MERFLKPKQPAVSTPDPSKMAPGAEEGTELGAPAGRGERHNNGNDMLPFSPTSDLSPCLPRSLSLTSFDSPGREPGDSLQWASQDIQRSQQQSLTLGVPLPTSLQASKCTAPLSLPSQEPSSMLIGEQALWTLLQKLPTRDDLDSVALRMEAALRGEITGIKQTVAEVSTRVANVELDTTTLRQDVTTIQDAQEAFIDQIAQLHLLIDDLENRNRRRNIRIRGLPEATQQADLKMTVTAIFNACLERPTETPIAIGRVHRTLGPRNTEEDRPRDVLCCLHNYSIKEDILQRAWHRGHIDFDGAQISLLPDVSRRTLQMRRCMKPLLESFGEQGITYKWGHPFHLIARKGGRSYVLRHPREVPTFLNSLGLPSLSLPNWLAFVLTPNINTPGVDPSGRPQRHRRNRRSQRRRPQAPQDNEI